MRVRVKIFAAPSLALESREIILELADDATADDLLDAIPVQEKRYLYIVRDGIRLDRSSRLRDGDEVLLIPPIAGG